jgi:hypothetical protein
MMSFYEGSRRAPARRDRTVVDGSIAMGLFTCRAPRPGCPLSRHVSSVGAVGMDLWRSISRGGRPEVRKGIEVVQRQREDLEKRVLYCRWYDQIGYWICIGEGGRFVIDYRWKRGAGRSRRVNSQAGGPTAAETA